MRIEREKAQMKAQNNLMLKLNKFEGERLNCKWEGTIWMLSNCVIVEYENYRSLIRKNE